MDSDRKKVLQPSDFSASLPYLNYPIVIWKELISNRFRFLARLFCSWKRIRINYDLVPYKTSIFLGWCHAHRLYYLDYEHGWRKEIFCPECFKEVMQHRSLI